MKNFTVFYETFENHLFTKDVGIISYIMQKYYGYNSKIRCIATKGEIVDDKKYLENIDFKVMETEDDVEEMCKTTDILMLIGMYEFNMKMIIKYKELNPRGKVYLKLDANPTWMFSIYRAMTPRLKDVLSKCSLITVESRRLQQVLRVCFNLNIQFIPNGHHDFTNSDIIDYKEKENTILFAGRVGNPVKANHVLVDAFANVSDLIPDWTLELAGAVEDEFLIYLSNWFKLKPELKSRIRLTGQLNKDEVKQSFRKAKVFCLSSPGEACAHVFSESIYNGCYLISTDVDGAIDITDYGRYGQLFPIYGTKELETCLLEVCNNKELLEKHCKRAQLYALENLTWVSICKKLDELLKNCR